MQKLTCRVLPATASSDALLRLDEGIEASAEYRALPDEARPSSALLRKLIQTGHVYLNGKQARSPAQIVRPGAHVDLYWDVEGRKERMSSERFLPLRILYEDEALVCLDKPAGIPSQPTIDPKRPDFYRLAQTELARIKRKKDFYLGLHHRLDRDTSGVILFTIDPAVNAFVGEQFRGHRCEKTYVALVEGKLKRDSGTIESFLAETSRRGKVARHGSVKTGGKKAISEYRVLDRFPKFGHPTTLVEVRIQTGRTHQIRVHLSELGHPILGDTLYGARPENYRALDRFLLHAHALTIEHPITHNRIRVESPVPTEFRK